jgi:hypothetical protein
VSGISSAQPPGNGKLSSNHQHGRQKEKNANQVLGSSDMSIDDQIAMHLVDCSQCRESVQKLKPRGLGQKSGHCDVYWQLQLMRARYEGEVNNIVAYTEYGDEARKGGSLE